MRPSEVRLDAQGFIVGGQGLFKPTLFLENDAAIVVRLGIFRLNAEGFVVGGQGVLEGPLFLKNDALAVVIGGVRGIVVNGLGD